MEIEVFVLFLGIANLIGNIVTFNIPAVSGWFVACLYIWSFTTLRKELKEI